MVFQSYKNLFFLIIIISVYIWILCLIINLLIFNKVIIRLTEPIKILKEAIESSTIKDENIFKYEYDEFINDLFLTSKELLTGQFENNNNEQGMGKFDILSMPNDKKSIDKNIYQRNLIINNDIINQLIMEQQNMMDFSKNIKINEELDKNNNDNLYKKQYKSSIINEEREEEYNNKGKENDKKYDNNQIKLKEEEDREPYKKYSK